MKRHLQLLFTFSLLTFTITKGTTSMEKEHVARELLNDSNKLAFILCSTAVSVYINDQDHKDKARELLI
jgi:hypothetical protein